MNLRSDDLLKAPDGPSKLIDATLPGRRLAAVAGGDSRNLPERVDDARGFRWRRPDRPQPPETAWENLSAVLSARSLTVPSTLLDSRHAAMDGAAGGVYVIVAADGGLFPARAGRAESIRAKATAYRRPGAAPKTCSA